MRAITVEPGVANSAKLEEMPEPAELEGDVLVKTVAIGVCGTDLEIARGDYGWAPAGQRRLILGHESIGHVSDAAAASGLRRGDWVVGIVRRPDPVPCPHCAVDEWDMCSNGQYTEHGIKSLHGFAAESYRSETRYLVRVDAKLGFLGVLLEPTSVVAKAWEQAARIGARSRWLPRRVLVTGAGPIGLLAALLGTQRGLDVHVFDRATDGHKPALVRALGATYHSGKVDDLAALPAWDLVFECTGAPELLFAAIRMAAPDGIVCLTGVSSGGHVVSVDPGALNREIVLENNVVFGSVNANRRHYEQAAAALAQADADWLARLLTRKVAAADFQAALARQPDDIKTVIMFA